MKKIKVLGAVTMLGLMAASVALAAQFVAPVRGGNGNITVASGETHKNLYVAGGSVTVDSDVSGDLFVAGGMVTVNGKTEKDLFVGGGNISINGNVGDDLRVGGGNVTINSPVAGDVLVGGGNVSITTKSSIAGDLTVGGGNVVIDSPVNGNLKIGGGSVTINSKINGTVEVMASKDLTFGPNSEVPGKIIYRGPKEATIADGAKVSTVEFTMVAHRNGAGKIAALITIAGILKLLGLFIAAWVFNRLFPGKFQTLANYANSKPWHSLGIGAAALIGTPIAAVILMITILGLYLGLALFAVYFLFLLLAGFLAPYFVGALLISWYNKSAVTISWQGLVYGLLAMTIVGMIPIIGWLAVAIIYIISLGSLVIYTFKREANVSL